MTGVVGVRAQEAAQVGPFHRLVQQGRTLAVVRTQVLSAEGKLVLECTSQHIAAR